MGEYRHWGIFNWEVLELGFDDFGNGHFGIKGGWEVSSKLLLLVLLMLFWGESVENGEPSMVGGWTTEGNGRDVDRDK